MGWSAFTFAILDTESIENHDLLMCSDGPDFGEGYANTSEDETKLKSIRMTFTDFAGFMPALEVLTVMPGEVNNEKRLNVTPPLLINPEYPGMMVGKIDTPNEMRKRKREAIWKAEAKGWAEKHGVAESESAIDTEKMN
jgi:hypothetical protein